MNQACVRNDTIDAGNHHGRPQYRQQYRPFLQFLTTQERNVIWLLLAIPGWLKFGIHLNAAFMSITGLLGVLATLGAIAIAFGIKRIPWRTPLRILIASYWFSFGVGVVQWLSIHLHIKPLTDYFAHLMYRQYINESSVWGGGRPQFLFAEPSYIGMHLFGVLLPLMWLLRDAGYDLVIYPIEGSEARDAFFEELPVRSNADAVFVSSFGISPDEVKRLGTAKIPIIGINTTSEGFDATVGINDKEGIKLIV